MATRLGLYGGPRGALSAGAAIASVSLTGTATAGLTEAQVDTGGETFVWTLTNDTFVAAGTGPIGSTADSQAVIDGIVSSGAEAFGWNNIRSGIAVTDLVRTSDTVATLTLPALATHDIIADEVLTSTVPAAVLTGGTPLVAPETVTITADAAEGGRGGHFMPGMAGIRAGKRRLPRAALEAAAEVVEAVVADVLEEEKRPEPIKRVSRARRSDIIDRAAAEFARQGVFIGELAALERAATRIAAVALKRRREALKRAEQANEKRATLVQPVGDFAEDDAIILAVLASLYRI